MSEGPKERAGELMRDLLCMCRLISPLLAIVAATGLDRGWAADPLPVRMAIQSPGGRSRSQAPQTFEVTLSNQTQVLVEGELELSIFHGRRLVQKYRSDPLALGQDSLRYRIMVPPIAVHREQSPVTAVGKLVNGRRTLDLQEHDLVVPPSWKRWFVLAISRPETEVVSRDLFTIEAALSPERFNIVPMDATLTDLLTTPAVMVPELFPTTSAGYASFDVVLLEGGGFSQLREGQLTALAAWVEAGGSVVVRPTDALKSAHVAFLNRLSGAGDADPLYRVDERGRLDATSPALAQPLARYHSGQGRAVVLHQPRSRDEDFRSGEWIETAMFAWKIRTDQQESIRQTGKWNFFVPPQGPFRGVDGPRLFAPVELPLEATLRKLLIPEKVQGLPFWVVVAILATFLVLIAPGDYFLLGALRARRLTWVTMTVTSLAFTFGTARITERVMGTTDYRRGIVFADLGPEGRPLRTSRYELLFTATQKMLHSRFQNEIHTLVDDRLSRPGLRSSEGEYIEQGVWDEATVPRAGLVADLPEYVGKMPADYEVRQQMRQWSPLVTRQTKFGGSIDVPPWNWTALEKLPWDRAEGRQELRDAILAIEPKAQIYLFHGTQMHDVIAEQDSLAAPPIAEPTDTKFIRVLNKNPDALVPYAADNFKYIPFPTGTPAAKPLAPLAELVRQACVGPQQGLFRIVSQVAPTGGDSLEDLALLDPSDDEQWLLAIVVPRGDDQMVFRRLCRRTR